MANDDSSNPSGLMSSPPQSIVGGLMGLRDPDLLLNIGLGLMSSARYGGNAGVGLMQGLQSYQQQRLGQQQYQMGQLDLARQRALFQMGLGALQGAPQNGPGSNGAPVAPGPVAPSPQGPPAPPSGPAPPPYLAANPPQSGAPAVSPPPTQLPPGLTPPSMDSIYSTPVGGMDPRFLKASALMAGRNPLPDLNSLREQQLKLAQQQYGPAIAKLDTLVKSDSPAKYMQADQELRTAWTPLAMKLGMDPVKDLTDQNVRTAFTFGRNALAGSLQEPIEAPNVPLEQIHGSLNSLYSRNPVNNEIKQEKPEEELKPVIGADGKPTLVQASQAAGRTPFNPSIFGAASLSDQSKEFAYQAYVATGKLPATFSRSPAMQATMLDYISQRAKQDGNSAASIAANGQLFTARQQAEKAYAPGGQNYKTIQSLNTAVAHLDTMRGLAAALDNGDVQLINRAKNAVATQFGGAAPTNIDAAAKVVGQEVTKAIVANGGGEAERRAAAEDFSTVKSWGQLSGTISTYLDLMRGQLDTQRNGYQQTLGRSDFDNKFLTSRARQALGGSGSSTPAGNSAGALSDQALLKKWGGG